MEEHILLICMNTGQGDNKEDGTRLFSVVFSEWTRDNGYKLFFFCVCVKVVKHWNKLPRQVVESPSTEIFKTQLDNCPGQLPLARPAFSSGGWTR